MRFMCWDMDIEHRNDIHLTNANYFSRLGSDLCYDPLLRDYMERVARQFGVMDLFRFNTEVEAADWDAAARVVVGAGPGGHYAVTLGVFA